MEKQISTLYTSKSVAASIGYDVRYFHKKLQELGVIIPLGNAKWALTKQYRGRGLMPGVYQPRTTYWTAKGRKLVIQLLQEASKSKPQDQSQTQQATQPTTATAKSEPKSGITTESKSTPLSSCQQRNPFINLMYYLRNGREEVARIYHAIYGEESEMEEATDYIKVQEDITKAIDSVGKLLGNRIAEKINYYE